MKRMFFLLSLVFLVFPLSVLAESRVNVSTDINSSSTTDVTIEVNGEKKTFHAEGDEDINWTSDDGKSSVKINSNEGTSPSPKPSRADAKIEKEIEETKKDIFELLKKEIERIKSLIFDSLKDLSPF
ncbi:hypothetical protein HYW54_00490 [Candidatus Gottesmanbacteria bacterium]|nr:hypothetical protein [Candidatus Gottesmanbacteria bacterium]